jgi:hypothetical protein
LKGNSINNKAIHKEKKKTSKTRIRPKDSRKESKNNYTLKNTIINIITNNNHKTNMKNSIA